MNILLTWVTIYHVTFTHRKKWVTISRNEWQKKEPYIYSFILSTSLQFSPNFKVRKSFETWGVSINDTYLSMKYFSILWNSRESERNERNIEMNIYSSFSTRVDRESWIVNRDSWLQTKEMNIIVTSFSTNNRWFHIRNHAK